jgi:hypothetical protein
LPAIGADEHEKMAGSVAWPAGRADSTTPFGLEFGNGGEKFLLPVRVVEPGEFSGSGPVKPVAEIAETGQDIFAAVKRPVERAGVDGDFGM